MRRRTILAAAAAASLLVAVSHAVEWQPVLPDARNSASLVVDTLNRRAILFAGRYLNDAWEMNISNTGDYDWTKLRPAGTPPDPRWGHRSLYIPGEQRMLVIAGTGRGGQLNDVWSLDLSRGSERWDLLNPSGTPPSVRDLHFPIYHPGRHSVLLFGGAISGQRYNDLYELKLDSMCWRRIDVSGQLPTARSEGCVMFDRAGNRMIVFGGRTNESFLNDVWALDLTPGSEGWQQLSPSGSPPSLRAGSGWASNPQGTQLYVFGGWYYSGIHTFYNDLYVLDLSDTGWTRIMPTGELPVERRGAAGCHDPWHDRFVIMGGDNEDGLHGDAFWIDLSSVGVTEWQTGVSSENGPALHVNAVARRAVEIGYSVPPNTAYSLRIMDVSGRLVRSLGQGSGGLYGCRTTWDGCDDAGRRVGAGTYYAYLQVDRCGVSRRFALTD